MLHRLVPLPFLFGLAAACTEPLAPGDGAPTGPAFAKGDPIVLGPMVQTVSAHAIGQWVQTLTAGQPETFTLSGCAAEMRLLAPSGLEVRRSTSTITYTPTTTGAHVMLFLSFGGSGAPPLCSLRRNGAIVHSGAPAGGALVSLFGLRVGEHVETVLLPGGTPADHTIFLTDAAGAIRRRVTGAGTAGGVALAAAAADAGNVYAIVGRVSLFSGPGGPLRVIRNDAFVAPGGVAVDADLDGLGNQLEAALGTCSQLAGTVTVGGASFDCGNARDPRDTDGDGIRDAWEVLGRRNFLEHQALPLWGADPRHKDLFIELDRARDADNVAAPKMSPEVARKVRDIYLGEVGPDEGAFRRDVQAVLLRNPDRQPGIRVHLDTGMAPLPGDETLYGDWGGTTIIPRGPGNTRANAADVIDVPGNFVAARRGIFHYAVVDGGGGGQQGVGAFPYDLPVGSAAGFAHELGHGLGLAHGGTPGWFTRNVNCKPNYPSLMSYAALTDDTGFSDGVGFPGLDNTAAPERDWFAPGDPIVMDFLQRRFAYKVDPAGHVDWNRDGVFSPWPVRAYANNRPGGACESTRDRLHALPGAAAVREPAIARLGTRVYALFGDSEVKVSWLDDAADCLDVETGTAGCPWAPITFITGHAMGRGVDAVTLAGGASPHVLVVTADGAGNLTHRELRTVGGQPSFSAPIAIPRSPNVIATTAPALATLDGVTAFLAWRGSDGLLHTNRRDASGAWGPDTVPTTGLFGAPYRLAAPSAPGLVSAWRSGSLSPTLYAVLDVEQEPLPGWLDRDLLQVRFDPATGTWGNPVSLGAGGVVVGRPAIAWQQTGASLADGVLVVVYRDVADMARVRRRAVTVSEAGGGFTPADGPMDAFLTNGWLTILGADVLQGPADAHPHLLVVNQTDGGQVQMWPLSDGIAPGAYGNANDWPALGDHLCLQVSSQDASPVTCW